MEKIKRSDRLVAMTRILAQNPNKIISFQGFCDQFHAAKSTISEDIAMIARVMEVYELGTVTTITGAAGGVRFRAMMPWHEALETISEIAHTLNHEEDRTLPGGYLYLLDLLSNPVLTRKMGCILAQPCYELGIDFVLTMETKGIPVAMMTAETLNVPLVIARRSSKVYEGSAVNINYPDGKGGIETMSLARRAVAAGQRALIVDDFTRHGGTALGMIALMKEFNTQVAGLAFMLAMERGCPLSDLPEWPLMTFTGDGIHQRMVVQPARWLAQLGENKQ